MLLTQPPVPAEYLPLHKYLHGRYADMVVLTIGQIEDLIGMTLPAAAWVEAAWWEEASNGDPPSPQARSWVQAKRTARPNLPARTVMFERIAV